MNAPMNNFFVGVGLLAVAAAIVYCPTAKKQAEFEAQCRDARTALDRKVIQPDGKASGTDSEVRTYMAGHKLLDLEGCPGEARWGWDLSKLK